MSNNHHLALLEKGWTPPDRKHPLAGLHRKPLRFSYEMLVLQGPEDRSGAVHFEIFLLDAISRVSCEPVVVALHSQGEHRGYNWIDISVLRSRFCFGVEPKVRHVYTPGLPWKALEMLCGLVPPGGHITVDCNGLGHEETAMCLSHGVPPVATPPGFLIFNAGCGASFMIWESCRGCGQGPRKLQGFKAVDACDAEDKGRAMAKDIRKFLADCRDLPAELEPAKKRAKAVLNQLDSQSLERLLAPSVQLLSDPPSPTTQNQPS
ncbi:MAG: DUF1122 family protein [Chloroflexi bacterium]|nr:DUF1122 family protein [Chloroflexota bacterium]